MATTNTSFSDVIADIKARAEALSETGTAKDLVYLAKAVEALNLPSTVSDIVDEGTTQVGLVTTEGTTQVGLVTAEGTSQLALLFDAGSVPIVFKNPSDTFQSARINWPTAEGAYNLPAASSLSSGQYIIVEKADRYAEDEVTVNVAGSDTITYRDGTTNQLILDSNGVVTVRFVSDGVSNWSI